ncbi:uncharacterized protein [Coffea arabica]|uniref:Zinc finger PMZ-type domain-containing protein n=1 Tax=Coffea arabica TaxID=13443 RepID=A0ABM4WPB6_COFAR
MANNSDTDNDNSNIDVAPNSGSDIDSLQGSDKEGHSRPPMKRKGDGRLEVRTFQQKQFSSHYKSVKSGWVGRKYVSTFRENPKLDYASFKNLVAEDYCDLVTKQGKFQRLYMCFTGVKKGFLDACRLVFGLDGTFLKGAASGVLLTAAGVNPNNGLYPIAYAAIEGETKHSWIWFLTLVKEDLKIEKDYKWIIMSDKQKGIIQTCEIVFLGADHRFCMKHMHSNMATAGFKRTAMRRALWKAAKATTHAQFIRRIEAIAKLEVDAIKWLEDKNSAEWSKSHFRTFSKCAMLLNNICKSFNNKILDGREGFIVVMMEALRHFVMQRMQENRDRASEKWSKFYFYQKIRKRKTVNIDNATYYVPYKSNDVSFEIACPYGEKWTVNIEDWTCSYRKWDLIGIPCSHANLALWIAMKDPMQYINGCYTIKMYLKCYDPCILPVNGKNERKDVDIQAPLPPTYGRAP